MRSSQLVALVSCLLLASAASALTPEDLAAGATVTAVLPVPQTTAEVSGAQFQHVKVTIGDNGRAVVNGNPDWYLNSPLQAIQLHVVDVKPGNAMTTVSLRSSEAVLEVLVVAPPSEWEKLIEAVLIPGPATSEAVRARLEQASEEKAKRDRQ